jgi:dihydrofolate reductase
MSRLRVHAFSVSIDGFGAGPRQDLEHPLGVGGTALHEWAFATRTFHRMHTGEEGGATGVDDDLAARGFAGVGAWILGRNMFGPVRGPWPDDAWKGWWGETPPYHVPVFVLTHHARASFAMNGGTTFHFVTGGIHEALARAKEAAGALDLGVSGRSLRAAADVRLGGGPATIRQYLAAGLVDELHLAITPVLLGSGEALFAGMDLTQLGYRCTEHVTTPAAMHVVLTKGG